jgi:hypothetical protein
MAASSETTAVPLACEVRQTRDRFLVQRAFNAMSAEARNFLWERMELELRYELGELPDPHTLTGQQLLWHELLNAAHHAAGTFFVVYEYGGGECEPVFISADWTTARAFARWRSARMRTVPSLPGLSTRSEEVVSGVTKKGPAVVSSGRD